MDVNRATELINGIESEELYDSEILTKLDWEKSEHMFQPVISPSRPGQNLIMRSLASTDYDKGFLDVLSHLTHVGEITREQFLDSFHKMKACKNMYYVTVIEDTTSNLIVGSATLFLEQKFIHTCALRGRIEDVVVSQSYQGKQLGKLIVETLKQLAIYTGCYKLSLDCKDEMLKFYQKLGFVREEGNSNSMTIRFLH